MSENESSEVKVNDNRMFNPDGTLRNQTEEVDQSPQQTEPKVEAKPQAEPTPAKQDQPSPSSDVDGYTSGGEIDFPTFLMSLASSAQISLGLVPHPITGESQRDLAHAKQTIDILGLVETKTQGNLNSEESGLLKNILFQLRMQYVELSKDS